MVWYLLGKSVLRHLIFTRRTCGGDGGLELCLDALQHLLVPTCLVDTQPLAV